MAVFALFCGGDTGTEVALPAAEREQSEHWEQQEKEGILSSRRTIKFRRNGKIVESGRYDHMVSRGVTPEMKAERRAAASANKGAKMKGQPQLHSMEGCAIWHLLKLFGKWCPKKAAKWTFEAVFDGMIADVMARHASWPKGEWMSLQFKSASIKFGVMTNYGLSAGCYPESVFCIGIGLLDYVPSATPSDPNNLDSNARVYEVWNIGRSANLNPTPATLYAGLAPNRRTFISHKPYAEKDQQKYIEAGLDRLLDDMKAWPHRFKREEIQYEQFPPGAVQKATEAAGIRAIDEAVAAHGYTVSAPWRQGETVDSIMTLETQSGLRETFVSNKTATIVNGDLLQRSFKLSVAKFDELCHVIIASYAGDHTRVALMLRETVYDCGKKNFYWNESDGAAALAAKGVRIFDLTVEEEARAFCAAVEAAGAKVEKPRVPAEGPPAEVPKKRPAPAPPPEASASESVQELYRKHEAATAKIRKKHLDTPLGAATELTDDLISEFKAYFKKLKDASRM